MSFAFLGDLMIVTAINFVIVTGITFGVLYTIDKFKSNKDEEQEWDMSEYKKKAINDFISNRVS